MAAFAKGVSSYGTMALRATLADVPIWNGFLPISGLCSNKVNELQGAFVNRSAGLGRGRLSARLAIRSFSDVSAHRFRWRRYVAAANLSFRQRACER